MKKRGKLDDTLANMFSNNDYKYDYMFYAHMIGQCSIKIDYNLPAAAGVAFITDHYNLYINPNLFDEYTLIERLAILKHESLHILSNHVERTGLRSMRPWNYATDCAINQLINPDHLHENWIYPKTLGEMIGKTVPDGKWSEFYYDMISDKIKEDQKNGKGEGQGNEFGENLGKNAGDPQPFDDHSTWEKTTGDKELQADLTKNMIEKSQNETIKGKGTIPNAISDWLELHSRTNEVNWKQVLRGIVGNKRVSKRSTIMRRDRRLPLRKDLRGKIKDRMFNLLLIGDVSGSMNDNALLSAFSEVQNICDVTKTELDLIQVDTEAYIPEKFSKSTKVIERKGRGGTYLFPAIERAHEYNIDFDAVVIVTDGGLFGDDVSKFKELNKRIIWIIEPSGTILPEMEEGKMIACKLKEQS